MNQPALFPDTAPATSWPFVAYDMPSRASWNGIFIVGEAPGAEEVRLGHPFVGRSGQLLDKALHSAGIERRQSLVANVFRHQPPGNKVDLFFLSRRAAQQAGEKLAEEWGPFSGKYCRAGFAEDIDHLRRTLEAWRPKAILAVGRTPLWALSGQNGLIEKVGTPQPCRLLAGTIVMPTYHPSFILRGNWKLQPAWIDHMRVAREMS